MTEHRERRRFSRVNFSTPVTLVQGDQQWQGKLLDISLKGVLVELPAAADYDPQASLTASIPLSDQASINMVVQPAHQEDHLLGVECISIDMESIGHLRRLIELNLDDPTAAERELTELIATL
jgi:hypothetical protein